MDNSVDTEQYRQYLSSDAWRAIALKRLQIDNFTCQSCGSRGTVNNKIEIHHLTYRSLYHEGDRIFQDLVSLCHVCHKNLHNAMNRITSPSGRRGWRDNSTIPKIHTYSLSGADTEYKEESS